MKLNYWIDHDKFHFMHRKTCVRSRAIEDLVYYYLVYTCSVFNEKVNAKDFRWLFFTDKRFSYSSSVFSSSKLAKWSSFRLPLTVALAVSWVIASDIFAQASIFHLLSHLSRCVPYLRHILFHLTIVTGAWLEDAKRSRALRNQMYMYASGTIMSWL